MSYPPLTFVKLPGSPSSSPLRDGSPHLTRSRDATLSSSPLRAARETAVSSPARSAGSQACSGVSASEKRRSFWSDLFANSDSSSQDNEDDEDEDSEHPLRSSLSLFTSSATVHKRKRTAEPSQTARVIASAASFLTTKRPKLAHADDDDDEDDEDGKLELTVSNTARRMDSSSDNGVVILDDDDDVIGTAFPHHTPPPSPLSERSSNKEDGNGSPWIKRKRDVVATVKPTALHPQVNLSDDDDDEEEERSESDKENNGVTNDHRRHNVNQKPQPSVKRVDAKEPSSDRTNRDSLVAKNTSSAITADSAKPSKREVVVEIDEADSQANAAGDTASAPRLKFLSPFTEEEVKKWSKARLQAWKQRHRNANSYYYRFTDPTVAQSERKLSRDEHQTFMRRYEEFQRNGWRVGTSWGLFSMALPSRVGYQCANHYRKLLKEGKLNDNSFKLDPKGEVKLIEGADVRGHCGIENALSDVWKTKEVKAIEKYVDKWISEYHDGVSKVLAFPDDDDEANNVDGEDEQQLKEPKAATKAKRCRPQPTVTSFIASCDQPDTSRKVIVLDTTDEEAFDSGHHNRVTQPTKKRKRANSATEKEEEVSEEGRRGLNDSETDGSIDDPIEENIFVYAAQDDDGMDITTTTTTTSSTVTSFKRPQNVWKDFIIDPSEPLHAGRKPRTAAGRGRGLAGKAKQLDLSHFIPGLKPAPVIVEAEDNKSLIEKTVIPRPIPRSWAKVVQPFDYEAARGKKATPGSRYLETTIEALELEKLGSFEAILMDPPWDLSPRVPASGKVEPKRGNKGERLITPEELGRWPITDKLIPKGFLFIWTEKELIPRVLTMAQKWGFHYVENFAWVKFDVNNKIHTEDYAYFRKSKLTLLMLRKPGDIELRHQRNPDVKFDFVRKGRERLPFVYDIIETLLPTAKYNPKTGTGKMLQLWCLPKQRRSGWTSVHLTEEEEEEEESAGESPSPAAE